MAIRNNKFETHGKYLNDFSLCGTFLDEVIIHSFHSKDFREGKLFILFSWLRWLQLFVSDFFKRTMALIYILYVLETVITKKLG